MTIVTPPSQPVPRTFADSVPRWQQSMKEAVRDIRQLCHLLNLPESWAYQATASTGDFPLFVPREFIARMVTGDPHDPLLRQVLPLAEENESQHDESLDPVGDLDASLSPGLIQKYHGRVLLITTGACAAHCRYCFRRHFPYSDAPSSLDQWQTAAEQIEADPSIREVLLSGGDPLTLTDARIEPLVDRLASIGHLRRLRVHTRLPILIPSRVTDQLVTLLTRTRLQPIVVVHANHPAEIDEAVAASVGRLVDAGIMVLNQAVLLRGVNDSAATLADLCERLIDLRVMPYYLHQLDRVAGAAHFEVPIAEGLRIVETLRTMLPGYAVPRYVHEIAGEPNKVVLA